MTRASTGDAPAIEFPCDYPIKIVGDNHADFQSAVVEVTRRHAPEVTEERVSVRASRRGNYASVTIVIRATGEPQLKRLHEDLKRHPAVRLVL
jgi:putative lipoic acid-binding regulatory protein